MPHATNSELIPTVQAFMAETLAVCAPHTRGHLARLIRENCVGLGLNANGHSASLVEDIVGTCPEFADDGNHWADGLVWLA